VYTGDDPVNLLDLTGTSVWSSLKKAWHDATNCIVDLATVATGFADVMEATTAGFAFGIETFGLSILVAAAVDAVAITSGIKATANAFGTEPGTGSRHDCY
jgi:hypothetical protein